jgi:hypothetical protein
MGVKVTLHCDDAECDTWAEEGQFTEDWIVVHPGSGMETLVFCDLWHAVRTLAKGAEPATVVPFLDL